MRYIIIVLAALIFSGTAGAETREGLFIVSCNLSHRLQEDPIVSPGPAGTLSHHRHDFFGNKSTRSFSTYTSMQNQPTSCGTSGDFTQVYIVPTLLDRFGNPVGVTDFRVYYRNRPFRYKTTQ